MSASGTKTLKEGKGTNRSSKLDAVLQGADKVRVRELDDVEVVGLLHVLDPLIGLTLRVNHQRPATRVAENQATPLVMHQGKVIFRFK